MSRKDYIVIANALSQIPPSPDKERLVDTLCDRFRNDNRAFNTMLFKSYAKHTSETEVV